MIVYDTLAPISVPSVITIGNFDGFHQGHQANIHRLTQIAHEKQLSSILLTFHPHPRRYFKHAFSLIHTPEQKTSMLKSFALDYLFDICFTDVISMPAQNFIHDLLLTLWMMKCLIIGDDFRFGSDRKGNSQLLKEAASQYNFDLVITPPVSIKGKRVSSSAIRKLLACGDIHEANILLGQYYTIDGYVGSGEQIGRVIGYPTINLMTNNEIIPEGVFHTLTHWRGQAYPSVTSIGNRPTFNGHTKTIETHILNFQADLYNEYVKIHFIKKIRDQIKFSSQSALINQIKQDIDSIAFDKEPHF